MGNKRVVSGIAQSQKKHIDKFQNNKYYSIQTSSWTVHFRPGPGAFVSGNFLLSHPWIYMYGDYRF